MQAVFNLHPTFPNPQREVTAPPFEIEEHGWGEFEVNVVVRSLTVPSILLVLQRNVLTGATSFPVMHSSDDLGT